MVGQAERHGGRAAMRAAPRDRLGERLAEGGMAAQPVVFEAGQPDGRIPGRRTLGDGVGRAREAGAAVAEHAVEAFEGDRVRRRRHGAARRPHRAATRAKRRPRRCVTTWVRHTPGVRCRIDQA